MEERSEEIEVIHSWSAPRSLSTSLMYSFAQVQIQSEYHTYNIKKNLIIFPLFFSFSPVFLLWAGEKWINLFFFFI